LRTPHYLYSFFGSSQLDEKLLSTFGMIYPWVNHSKGTIHLLLKGDILTCYEQEYALARRGLQVLSRCPRKSTRTALPRKRIALDDIPTPKKLYLAVLQKACPYGTINPNGLFLEILKT
jgi:hypothetical protein